MLFASFAWAASAPGRPHVVFVTGDHEYGSEATFPLLAAALEQRYDIRTTVLKAHPDENAETDIPELEALADADLAVFFLRWRRLPREQVELISRYLNSGRPVIAFRTTTHAFNYPPGHELETWNAFAAEYLGAPPGWGKGHYHYGHTSTTEVRTETAAAGDSILTGVDKTFSVRSWLYHVLPNHPPRDARILLTGRAVNPERKDAQDNPVAWTWTNKAQSRVFMTTLGHPEDFGVEAFQRLVVNAIHWALDKPIPKQWAGKIAIEVPYHGIRKQGSGFRGQGGGGGGGGVKGGGGTKRN
ncbi:MAG: ThuA domain-containing protein [Acidobacteriota bacterium]